MLHCTVEGESKADRYAPCSLDDLKAGGLDAWALGHVHERRVLSETPFVAYPGNAQGLHVNEPGPRGCLLVTVAPRGGAYACASTFLRLGPVQWEKLDLDLDGVDHLDEVERRLNHCLEKAAEAADPGCEALMARVTLSGRTSLDALLRNAANQEDLAERLRHLSSGTPGVWLKDLRVETRSLTERSEYLQREDLLGEAMRLAERMRESREALQEVAGPALAPLFGHNRLRKVLAQPDETQIQALLQEAERLCMDLLEVR